MPPTPGLQFDGNTLIEPLGSGGFGDVWSAQRGPARIAIKFLTMESREALVRFEAEARALGSVTHPNCVRLLGNGTTHDGTKYIAMELVEGELLEDWLAASRGVDEKLFVTHGITDALAAIHSRGIVHRDLKPANIMVRHVGGRWAPVLLDFGISKLRGQEATDVTKTGVAIGTPGFMSPEQLRGSKDITTATDMYALGSLIWRMFAGRAPFEGSSALELSMQQLMHPAPKLQVGPPFLQPLTDRLLERDPSLRPSARVVMQAIESGQFQQEPQVSQRLTATPTTPPAPPRASFQHLALLAAALLILIGFALYVLVGTLSSPEPAVPQASQAPAGTALLVRDEAPSDDIAPPAEPEPIEVTTPDVGVVVPPLTECAKMSALEPGFQRFENSAVWLPPTYNRSRKHPVIIAFHDAYSDEAVLLNSLDPEVLTARESGYVVIAPHGDAAENTSHHWVREEVLDRVSDDIERALSGLCVDRERLFALGHGVGSRAIDPVLCAKHKVRAAATFGHREKTRAAFGCLLEPQFPLLAMMPLEDPLNPADGSRGCGMPTRISIPDMEKKYHTRLRCTSRRPFKEVEGGKCTEHVCARGKLVTCELEGGRRWPGEAPVHRMTETVVGARLCTFGPRPTFEITKHTLDFFDEAP